MISKALFREQIKVQYYLYFVILLFYQFFDGIYSSYAIKRLHKNLPFIENGKVLQGNSSVESYTVAVMENVFVWIVFIFALVFMQFHILRKKENISFMGSLPISRNSIITTTYVSGSAMLGIGFFVHSLAVLSHNSGALNGMLLWSLFRTAVFLWFVYTLLFAMQSFVLQNKWWGILTALTLFTMFTSFRVTLILSEHLPYIMQSIMVEVKKTLLVIRAIASNYVLVGNNLEYYMIANPTAVYVGITMGLLVLGAVLAFLARWCYHRTDDAECDRAFAIPMPRCIAVLYGMFVGYGMTMVLTFIFLFLGVIIMVFMTEYQRRQLSAFYGRMDCWYWIPVVLCTVAGGIVSYLITKKKGKERKWNGK